MENGTPDSWKKDSYGNNVFTVALFQADVGDALCFQDDSANASQTNADEGLRRKHNRHECGFNNVLFVLRRTF